MILLSSAAPKDELKNSIMTPENIQVMTNNEIVDEYMGYKIQAGKESQTIEITSVGRRLENCIAPISY